MYLAFDRLAGGQHNRVLTHTLETAKEWIEDMAKVDEEFSEMIWYAKDGSHYFGSESLVEDGLSGTMAGVIDEILVIAEGDSRHGD